MTETINSKVTEAGFLLSEAFSKLEKTVLEKLEEAKKINGFSDQHLENSQNLNSEINRLQKNLADLGVENETLMQKNNEMTNQLRRIREAKTEIVNAIKSDLERVKMLISNQN